MHARGHFLRRGCLLRCSQLACYNTFCLYYQFLISPIPPPPLSAYLTPPLSQELEHILSLPLSRPLPLFLSRAFAPAYPLTRALAHQASHRNHPRPPPHFPHLHPPRPRPTSAPGVYPPGGGAENRRRRGCRWRLRGRRRCAAGQRALLRTKRVQYRGTSLLRNSVQYRGAWRGGGELDQRGIPVLNVGEVDAGAP